MCRERRSVPAKKRRWWSAHDATAAFRVSRARDDCGGGANFGRRRRCGDGARRWDGFVAEHEATAAGSADVDEFARDCGVAWRSNRCGGSGAAWGLLDAGGCGGGCAVSKWTDGAGAGGFAGGYATHSKYGDAGRELVPGYAMQLLRPEL